MRSVICLTVMVLFAALSGCHGNGVEIRGYEQPGYPLRHVVLFAWKAGTPPQTIGVIEQAFAALPDKIPSILNFEWGTDVSVENRNQGYTHCFLVSFADEAGRDAYLSHPAHKQFVTLIKPHLEKVLVVDYWARH